MSLPAADPASKVARVFTVARELFIAIRDYEYIPIRADGTAMTIQQKPDGGYLLDGRDLGDYFTDRSIPVYRFILETDHGVIDGVHVGVKFDTGASYAECIPANPDGCRPMQFGSLDEAVQYSFANDEIPVRVESIEETWEYVLGQRRIPAERVIPGSSLDLPLGWIAAAIGGAWLLLRR